MELVEKNKSKYKKTSFGFIPEDWNLFSVKEITLFHKQGYYTQERYSANASYFLLRGTDMQNPRIDLSSTPKINANQSDYESYKVLPGDFLFVRSGAIGRYGIVPENFPMAIFGSYLINFRFNEKIDRRLFGYFYQSDLCLNQIKSITQGGANLNINAENIKALSIPLPPTIAEQEAIAEALSDTDAMISSLEKLIAKKKLIKQGMMQKLLTPKEGWVKKKLGEVAEFMNGKGHEQFISECGQYIVINSKFVSTEGTVFKNSSVNLCPLSKNDITIVMSDIPNGKALAKCFIVPADNLYALNQRIGGIRAVSVHYKYLAYVLNRNDYYLSFDSGSGQTNLKKNDVLDCPLYFPATMEEQKEIATIIEDIENEIRLIENKHKKYQEIKQGMMQVLLTGRVRLV